MERLPARINQRSSPQHWGAWGPRARRFAVVILAATGEAFGEVFGQFAQLLPHALDPAQPVSDRSFSHRGVSRRHCLHNQAPCWREPTARLPDCPTTPTYPAPGH
ncbi:MAG: hypothetical protein ACTHNK_14025 [Thermomicrobiales bacterium]